MYILNKGTVNYQGNELVYNLMSNTLCCHFISLFRWGRQIWILLAISIIVIKANKSLSICMQSLLLLTFFGGGQLYCCNWIERQMYDQVTNTCYLLIFNNQTGVLCTGSPVFLEGIRHFVFFNLTVLVLFCMEYI